jgi:hypothetical protein
MKRARPLWDSRTSALTPSVPDQIVNPDLAVEEILFQSYLREKAKAERLMSEVFNLREKLRRSRMLGMTSGMRKGLKPRHLDRPAKKGTGL